MYVCPAVTGHTINIQRFDFDKNYFIYFNVYAFMLYYSLKTIYLT